MCGELAVVRVSVFVIRTHFTGRLGVVFAESVVFGVFYTL